MKLLPFQRWYYQWSLFFPGPQFLILKTSWNILIENRLVRRQGNLLIQTIVGKRYLCFTIFTYSGKFDKTSSISFQFFLKQSIRRSKTHHTICFCKLIGLFILAFLCYSTHMMTMIIIFDKYIHDSTSIFLYQQKVRFD